jgi:ATP-binding cassette subfamily B multidrug efflux pump
VSSLPQSVPDRRRARPASNGGLGRAIGYLTKQRRLVAIAYGSLIIATLAQLAVPQLVQNMIDAVTRSVLATRILTDVPAALQPAAAAQLGTTLAALQADAGSGQSLVINAALLIVAFAVMRGLFAFAQSFAAEQTSHGLAFDLRNAIFEKIQRLSFSYYDRNQTGQLMIRATDDVERVRTFAAQGLVLAAQSVLLLVGTLVILAFTNWQLTLVVIPLLPVALAVFVVFGRVTQPIFREIQTKLSALNTVLQENLAGIKVVKAFVREPFEEQRFDRTATDLMDFQLKVNRLFSFLFPVVFLVAQIGQAAILYAGGAQILGDTLTLGEYQKFSLYLAYVFFPLGQLGFLISLLAQAGASAGRIFEVLDAQSDIVDAPDAITLPPIVGAVEFRNVTMRYPGGGEPVLSELSFRVEPGRTVALLGATGSGKTTVINLIPRFYDPSEGSVLIDGHDLRSVTIDSLRSQIGMVLQETNLFSGTIRDNIAFGRPDATDEEVIAAAQAAAAHDFITAFPAGYQTPVGERGATLSGGQRQRVAIARALLLNPRLLILDDSTSSVDVTTERTIQRALDQLMRDRTSIVIAQRISTVRNADVILVLDRGRVAAVGTHSELIESSAVYAEIAASQLIDDSETARRGEETH